MNRPRMMAGAHVLYDLLHYCFDWHNYLDPAYYFQSGMWGGPLAYLAVVTPAALLLAQPSGRFGPPPVGGGPPPPVAPGNLTTYFPDTAINMVNDQINRLAPAQELAFFDLVLYQLEYLLGVPGVPMNALLGDAVGGPVAITG